MRKHAFISIVLPLAVAAFSLVSTASTAQSIESNASIAKPVVDAIGVVTLDKAVQWTLSNNPDISVARREYEASEGALVQGQVRPNPEIAFTQEGVRSPSRASALQVNLPIELGGKRQARIDVAKRTREVAAIELGQRQSEARATVMSAFFDVLAAQEHIRLAQETLALTQRVTDMTGKRVNAGKISPVEETRARVVEAQARVELAQAQGDLRASRHKLAAQWGEFLPRFERVDGAFDLPNVPEVTSLELRVSQSLILRRAELELQRRVALTKLEQAKRVPDPVLSLGIKRSVEASSQIIFGASLPVLFFDSNQGNVLEALRREDKARDELSAQQLRLQSEALQARERLLTARTGADVMKTSILPGAQSAYSAATKGFDAGKFSFLEALDAQRTLIQVQSQYFRTVTEAHRAAFDIERLLGDAPIEQLNRN